jgi:hypothetical protein
MEGRCTVISESRVHSVLRERPTRHLAIPNKRSIARLKATTASITRLAESKGVLTISDPNYPKTKIRQYGTAKSQFGSIALYGVRRSPLLHSIGQENQSAHDWSIEQEGPCYAPFAPNNVSDALVSHRWISDPAESGSGSPST